MATAPIRRWRPARVMVTLAKVDGNWLITKFTLAKLPWAVAASDGGAWLLARDTGCSSGTITGPTSNSDLAAVQSAGLLRLAAT